MANELPEGASLALGEAERIQAALQELSDDEHAPREISVKLTLHIHSEYPKHVGGQVVNNHKEERAALRAEAKSDSGSASSDQQ